MLTKAIEHVDVKSGSDAGTFVALISSFDKIDKFGDVVRPGAFAASIAAWRDKQAMLPVIYSHQSSNPTMHIGEISPSDLVEMPTGLLARGRFYLDEPIAAKVHAQLKRKALSQWSFGYVVTDSRPRAGGGRELRAVDLIEIGPTLVGVGDTATLDIKGDDGATEPDPPAPDPLAAHRAALSRALARLQIRIALNV